MTLTLEQVRTAEADARRRGMKTPEAAAIIWLAGIRSLVPDSVKRFSGPKVTPHGARAWLEEHELADRDWQLISSRVYDRGRRAVAVFVDSDQPNVDIAALPADAPALVVSLEARWPWRVTLIHLDTVGGLRG